jgi:Holliday junction resolvase RusA-like endonuclease
MKTTLTLPWPPTSNHAYATVRSSTGTSRRIKSQNAKNYALVAQILTKRTHPTPIFTMSDRIAVTLVLHPPDHRRFDIANREKILIDAVSPVLGFNDSQIDFITIERRYAVQDGTVIATISTYHPHAN